MPNVDGFRHFGSVVVPLAAALAISVLGCAESNPGTGVGGAGALAAAGGQPGSQTPVGGAAPGAPVAGMVAGGAGAPAGAGGADAGGADGSAGVGGAAAPTFSSLYASVFRSCANSACHGSPGDFMDLSTIEVAYQSLVNKPAAPGQMCATVGLLRVVPSQADQSLLVKKLLDPAPCGATMPFGGLLNDADQAKIRMWIAAGALND